MKEDMRGKGENSMLIANRVNGRKRRVVLHCVDSA